MIGERARTAGQQRNVAALLFPVTGRLARLEAAGVLIGGVIVAYFRVGWAAGWRGTVWAEDGSIFLAQALTRGRVHTFFEPYAGYLQVTPRVIAGLVVELPLAAQGMAMSLGAAVVQALVALVVYWATSAWTPSRLGRVLAAAVVVAVPVGPETTDSVANLQWFLLPGAVIALFCTPRSRKGWVVLAGVAAIACASSPFGVALFLLAIARAAIQRRRGTLAIGIATTVAFVAQTLVMVGAPSRTGGQQLHSQVRPGLITTAFLRRVVGDGVLGYARVREAHRPTSLVPGLAILLLLVVFAVFAIRRRRGPLLIVPGFLLIISFGLFSVEAVLSGLLGYTPIGEDRYYVTPTILFCTAVAGVVSIAVSELRHERSPETVGAAAAAIVLVGGQVFGMVTSWSTGAQFGRDAGPGWAAGVRKAVHSCQGRAGGRPVGIPVSPTDARHWRAELTCHVVRARR